MKNKFFFLGKIFICFSSLLLVLIVSLVVYIQSKAEKFEMPVTGANRSSYNQKSFWAYPWGLSGHHKGVDIFAKCGTPVVSATRGVVIFTGVLKRGGNVILIVGPGLKMYYYAHLGSIFTDYFSVVDSGKLIGEVSNTGNAKFKPCHLHFSIRSIFPFRNGKYHDPTSLLNHALL